MLSLLCGKTSADSWRRKKVVQMFFTSCVLISLNKYFASGKAKKGNSCNQLSITLPRQKPNQANKAQAGSQQQQREVCEGAPEVWWHRKQCPGPLWRWLALH